MLLLSRRSKSRRLANGTACDLGRIIRMAADETLIEFMSGSSLIAIPWSTSTAVAVPLPFDEIVAQLTD